MRPNPRRFSSFSLAPTSCSHPQGQRSSRDGPRFQHYCAVRGFLSSLAMGTKAHIGFFIHIFTPLSRWAKCHAEFCNNVPQYTRRRTNATERRRRDFPQRDTIWLPVSQSKNNKEQRGINESILNTGYWLGRTGGGWGAPVRTSVHAARGSRDTHPNGLNLPSPTPPVH